MLQSRLLRRLLRRLCRLLLRLLLLLPAHLHPPQHTTLALPTEKATVEMGATRVIQVIQVKEVISSVPLQAYLLEVPALHASRHQLRGCQRCWSRLASAGRTGLLSLPDCRRR